MQSKQLFFNYSIDCELPPEGGFGGPVTWEAAESSTRGFVEVMEELGMLNGTTLFVYPDVAVKQAVLFREMADYGVEIALHLNGMRYSRMKQPAWMGSLSYEDQLEAYRMAKKDIEDVIGRACLGYRACYASANDYTFPALEEAGFEWTSTSAAGNHSPEVYSCWVGGWRFPYHPSRENRRVRGDMPIYEIPIQRSMTIHVNDNPDRFLDTRAETPPQMMGSNGEAVRQILEENLLEMERVKQPVRVLMGASHNTNPFADRCSYQHQNLKWVCEYALQCAEQHGYQLVSAHFLEMKEYSECLKP